MRSLSRLLVMGGVAACLAAPASAARVRPTLKYLEINGSLQVDSEAVKKKYEREIDRLLAAQLRSTAQSNREARKYVNILEDGVKAMGDFGWSRLHIIKLTETEDEKPLLFLFEVIEKKDMATRLPFRSAPDGVVDDVSQLIAQWGRYETLGRQMESASPTGLERPDCPSFYCVWGAKTPELGKLEKLFAAKVEANSQLLEHILQQHKDPVYRRRAIFLLAYLRDGAAVAQYATYGLMDPDTGVREAALSVLNDITVHHTDVPIAIHEIHRLLDVPFPEDRTQVLALMLNLADNADYRRFLVRTASKQILRLLRTHHPNNSNMAYTVLSLLSRESYARDDYDAWDRWVWKTREAQETPKKE